MNDPFLAIRQAVRQLIDAEWENLRAGIHRPGSHRSEVLRRREERMNELRGLLAQALQPGIDAGFSGETVEERLSAVGKTVEGVTHWDRMLTGEPGGMAYLDPDRPVEWHEVDSLDDQADERLAELATRAQSALDGLQNLAIAATAKRRDPTPEAVKQVYALSGNRCAFPGCDVPLVDPTTGGVRGELTHIAGVTPGGPRYDPSQTDEERQGKENLILLCQYHHSVIDAGPYTAEDIRRMKAARETFPREELAPADELIRALLQKMGATINHGSIILPQGMTGGQVAHTIINLSPQAASESLPRHDQLVIRTHDFSAKFMAYDGYGTARPSKLTGATWVEYWVQVDLYNARLVGTGLMDIFLVFSRYGVALLREIPGRHTGQEQVGEPSPCLVTCMNLPSNKWSSETFRGVLRDQKFVAVLGCDEIYLAATTVDGLTYRIPLGKGISEA
jgi:hypothetical protein